MELNTELKQFFAEILDVLDLGDEIIVGEDGPDKLVRLWTLRLMN